MTDLFVSDSLSENIDITQFENQEIDELYNKYVHIVINRSFKEPIAGLLRVIQIGDKPEIDFKTDLSIALELAYNYIDQQIQSFEIQHNGNQKIINGPFAILKVKISDIDILTQTCTLSLHLHLN